MWYCGARGSVAERVYALCLATSTAGVAFFKQPQSPVLRFGGGTGTRSIVTPALLRTPEGLVCRENGKLRLWFSSCDFISDARYTLHETSSSDGITWDKPSDVQMENAYAPTVMREDSIYRLWYTDVRRDPWCFRYAESRDGRRWDVVLVVDQNGNTKGSSTQS